MKKIISFVMISSVMIVLAGCDSGRKNTVMSVPSLIKEGFTGKNSYEIVCIGFPKEGLQGIQKTESAKRAALLNAYYYTRSRFDDSVVPDRDGRTRKIQDMGDHVVIHYVIKKDNLKNRLKK